MHVNRKQKGMLTRILVGAVLLAAAILIPLKGWLKAALYLVP